MEAKTLALYLGCEIFVDCDHHAKKWIAEMACIDIDSGFVTARDEAGDECQVSYDEIKLLLRPLSSMTEEERDHYHSLVAVRERTMDEIIVKEAIGVQYLLSKGFDLFGLIEKREAIDATTNGR